MDPSSRTHFFWCDRGQGIRGECEAGKEFHPVDLFCDRMTPLPPVNNNPCFGRPDGVSHLIFQSFYNADLIIFLTSRLSPTQRPAATFSGAIEAKDNAENVKQARSSIQLI